VEPAREETRREEARIGVAVGGGVVESLRPDERHMTMQTMKRTQRSEPMTMRTMQTTPHPSSPSPSPSPSSSSSEKDWRVASFAAVGLDRRQVSGKHEYSSRSKQPLATMVGQDACIVLHLEVQGR
jgi:hypothetical protein